eukprot:TRINITY_DN67264_c0_g1_i1.p1 TRINITY_DN67264_c0_g1~~TRINITY_DN67264_c0_g1_i1.p1  ORF type:complete len:582 (+),score=97.88 TRINITY_DN67264_c0_g1_i1:55-1800(+)
MSMALSLARRAIFARRLCVVAFAASLYSRCDAVVVSHPARGQHPQHPSETTENLYENSSMPITGVSGEGAVGAAGADHAAETKVAVSAKPIEEHVEDQRFSAEDMLPLAIAALRALGHRVRHDARMFAVATTTEHKFAVVMLGMMFAVFGLGSCLPRKGKQKGSGVARPPHNRNPSVECNPSVYVPVGEQLDVGLRLYHSLRGAHGLYKDKLFLEEAMPSTGMLSTAATGFGFVSLVLMTERGLLKREQALAMASKTLQSLKGDTPGFCITRSANGFMAHWPDDSGHSDGEISTVDTAILVLGALFAGRYFQDPCLDSLVQEVAMSVSWADAYVHRPGGVAGMYLKMKRDGSGTGLTLPFNEYYLLAFCGAVVECQLQGQPGEAYSFFREVFSEPPTARRCRRSYRGIELLTDCPQRFLPSFVVQFCFYLSGHFAGNEGYRRLTQNAAEADELFWENAVGGVRCPWGSGAGAYPENFPRDSHGYKAAAIDGNSALVYSAPIVAGFLPFKPEGARLLQLWFGANDACKYSLPSGEHVLWRASIRHKQWRAPTIEAVDYATFLLGCGCHVLGEELFDRCRPDL